MHKETDMKIEEGRYAEVIIDKATEGPLHTWCGSSTLHENGIDTIARQKGDFKKN